MQIIEKNISEIQMYENNPRQNDEAVEPLANSITEFGFKVPIVVDKDGVIITGHTRYKAAQLLKLKTVPCIVADDLDEEKVKLFRLADNKVAEKAQWNTELLDTELSDIEGFDMEEFGFIELTDISVEDYFEDAEPKEDPEEEEIQCPNCGAWFTVE